MPISYQNLRSLMAARGVSGYTLTKKEKILSQTTWDRIAKGDHINTKTIAVLCEYFHVQPGDLMEYEFEDK
ncbi:MAG: helix-turn-helix transcriptional regulator [Oscillospiraceae bacterium]|nr:helix-turn-helix transcriptional regulator [Oscillospiraceae bacterium]